MKTLLCILLAVASGTSLTDAIPFLFFDSIGYKKSGCINGNLNGLSPDNSDRYEILAHIYSTDNLSNSVLGNIQVCNQDGYTQWSDIYDFLHCDEVLSKISVKKSEYGNNIGLWVDTYLESIMLPVSQDSDMYYFKRIKFNQQMLETAYKDEIDSGYVKIDTFHVKNSARWVSYLAPGPKAPDSAINMILNPLLLSTCDSTDVECLKSGLKFDRDWKKPYPTVNDCHNITESGIKQLCDNHPRNTCVKANAPKGLTVESAVNCWTRKCQDNGADGGSIGDLLKSVILKGLDSYVGKYVKPEINGYQKALTSSLKGWYTTIKAEGKNAIGLLKGDLIPF
ncbi:hypothetical protein K7432_006654 [Basidiobolus ranarum]|uniref:Uncharacterized protein n=1 Tax=Basidiobolus ranarum TaxID=34480 RepID=A0ABR2W1A8_9FUNG